MYLPRARSSKQANFARKAGQAWKDYNNNELLKNTVETLGVGGLAALYQLIASDMSNEEIAWSTGVGAAAAFAARPLLGSLGKQIGKPIDRRYPNLEKDIHPAAAFVVARPSERGREVSKKVFDWIDERFDQEGIQKGTYKHVVEPELQGRYNASYVNKDGTKTGFAEGSLADFGRFRGDNIAQAAVAFGAPFVLGTDDEVS